MTVTISFADAERGFYGLASNSGLALLFRDRDVVEISDSPALAMTLDVPCERWSVRWDGDDCGFDAVATAVAAPVRSEQLVRVEGTVRVGEETTPLDALGQVSSTTEAPSAALVRSVGVWLGDGGIVLESVRPRRAADHGSEEIWAALVEHGEPAPVVEPRLSTTYDGDGHQRRAGLELWMTEEGGYPVRAAGEVICGSSLDLGEHQLDLAFFRWHAHGAEGVGRYDILRKR